MNDWRDDYPEAIRSTEMLTRFEELSAQLLTNHSVVVVESKAGEVVLMSAAEYRSIMETSHVYASPANAKWVTRGLADPERDPNSASKFSQGDEQEGN